VTITATGLPGKPKATTLRPPLSIRPTAIGRPGRMAIRQDTASPRRARDPAGVVGLADAGAAGGDDGVGGVGAAAQRRLERGRIVANDTEVEGRRRRGAAASPRGCSGCCRRPSPA
jgi:hypothetical protein